MGRCKQTKTIECKQEKVGGVSMGDQSNHKAYCIRVQRLAFSSNENYD
jgi:hypothetical protein